MNTLTMHNIFKNSIITGGEIMLKSRILRKVLAVSLSAVTIFGAGFTSVGQFVGTNISASAIFGNQTYGDFWYEINDDGTVNITKYIGKNTYVTIPTAIYGRKVTTISGFYSSYPKNIIIPDTVTTLAEHAFNGCENLTDIVIPASVKTIGKVAFLGCTSLTGVWIPENAEIEEIGYGAFVNCINLVGIPLDSVKKIGDYAFNGCKSLTYLGSTSHITEIGNNAFDGCSSLVSFDLSENIENINDFTFSECKSLADITIPKRVRSIGRGAFYKCESLTNIIIPDGVTSIGSEVFSSTGLTDVIIPDSVTSMGAYAFYNCTDLTNVTISKNIEKIGSKSFSNCPNLKNIKFSHGCLTAIGHYAFDSCQSLESFKIPDGVATIGYGTFDNCTKLAHVTIPDTVTEIDVNAFSRCDENLAIYGAEGSYAEAYAHENDIPFEAVLSNTSSISARDILLGQTVTVNAKSTEDGCTYAVYYKKSSDRKWTTKQDFNANDMVTIKPAMATNYEICVSVKTADGKVIKRYFILKVHAKLKNTSVISAEELNSGDTITVTGSATDGIGNYQYQVVYKQTAQTKWTTAQAFSENSTVTFKPAKITTYDICVKVKDDTGTVEKKFFTMTVKDNRLKNISTISAEKIKKGDKITVNSSATGGAGDYIYAVYYKQKSQTKWTTKQDFNANSVVSIKPAKATDYEICVKVKDKDGTIAKQYFELKVID